MVVAGADVGIAEVAEVFEHFTRHGGREAATDGAG
jgi:hypothetical protein